MKIQDSVKLKTKLWKTDRSIEKRDNKNFWKIRSLKEIQRIIKKAEKFKLDIEPIAN